MPMPRFPRATTTTHDDEKLLQRTARGDRRALGALYDRYAAVLERYARTFCRADEARDIVHDTFVSLVARADQFDAARGDVRGWLYRCVRNRAFDSARNSSRRSRLLDRHVTAIPHHDGAVEQTTLVRQLFERAALSATSETMLSLTLGDELTCADAAARAGVPVGTVKSRVRRGLIALREVALRDRAA
jgi:RNA polymerase sigma-70 factor, ECF subfamily